mmetsp:Transcript_26246/g.48037  ORF Transcript_26246/g.48037 Transcript_26246/m.48037 type:complete len:330 (-) Transcript_26246:42-1031(-)
MEDFIESIGEELSPSQARETYETLTKVLGNIIQNPTEAKFRNLKKENKMVSEKLCRTSSSISVLLALGFEDTGATYTCPPTADLDQMRTCVELLECILVSTEGQVTEPEQSAPIAIAGAAATATVAATAAAAAAPAPAPTAAPSTTGFRRRDELEKQRIGQTDQLQAVRAAQKAQFVENPQGPPAPAPSTTEKVATSGYPASADAKASPDAKKKAPESAFVFKNASVKEKEKQQAALSLEEMRRQQKAKFKEFQSDPDAKKAEAYQRPASVANGGKAKEGWGDWMGSWFGGGNSSSGSGGSGRPRPQDRKGGGANIKTVGDLPKPVQRG